MFSSPDIQNRMKMDYGRRISCTTVQQKLIGIDVDFNCLKVFYFMVVIWLKNKKKLKNWLVIFYSKLNLTINLLWYWTNLWSEFQNIGNLLRDSLQQIDGEFVFRQIRVHLEERHFDLLVVLNCKNISYQLNGFI